MPATRKIRLIMELRQGGVTDSRVLGAIERVPREAFVPEIFKARAYENSALPIGAGQTISQPLVVGLMTQALEVGPRHKVLEVGSGSGYQTAILAKLCRRVYTIERIRELSIEAQKIWLEIGTRNVTSKIGDGWAGWPEQAPFDRIMVTAAPDRVPQALIDQLAEGGRLVLPRGPQNASQELIVIRKTPDGPGGVIEEHVGWVRFVPLVPGVAK